MMAHTREIWITPASLELSGTQEEDLIEFHPSYHTRIPSADELKGLCKFY